MVTEQATRQHVGIDQGEQWPAYAWPGGYPLVYVMDDGEVLGAECMNDPSNPVHFGGDRDGWRVEGVGVLYEGPAVQCAHCGRTIESAYGQR